MLSTRGFLRRTAVVAALAAPAFWSAAAGSDEGFPFGFEMTLEAAPQPGSKRIPTLEIGDNGEAKLDLWCKSGTGQFSVAGNTVIFVPGQLQNRDCPPARAQADDDLVTALSEASSWRRRGDLVSFAGTKPLRFRINTN
jgi:META domain